MVVIEIVYHLIQIENYIGVSVTYLLDTIKTKNSYAYRNMKPMKWKYIFQYVSNVL